MITGDRVEVSFGVESEKIIKYRGLELDRKR